MTDLNNHIGNKPGDELGNQRGTALQGFNYISTKWIKEAEDLFRAMDVKPNTTRKRLINYTIQELINNELWDKQDTIWAMAAHDRQAAKLNWKYPYKFTLTEVSSPSYSIDRGFSFDGATQFLKTGYSPASSSNNYSLNNNSFGIYSLTDINGASYIDMGSFNGSTSRGAHINLRNSNSFSSRNNGSAIGSTSNANSIGMFSSNRQNNTNIELWKNGIMLYNPAAINIQIENFEFYIGALNVSGSATNFSSRQYAFSFAGAYCNQLNLYNIVNFYLNEIGAI